MYPNCCRPNRQTNCCNTNNECLELENCCNIIRRNRSFCDCQIQQQQCPPPQRLLPDFTIPRAKNIPSKPNGKKRKVVPETSRRSSAPRNEQALDRNIDRNSERSDTSCPCPPCPPCPCPCPPCPCNCTPCCVSSNGKRASNGNVSGNGNGSNTKNLKNKQNYQQYQDMFVGNKKQRMEVINEEQEEQRCGCMNSEDGFFDSEHSKKIQESCADFLSIVHDTVLETVQKSVETIMRDYFQHTMEKVECLCTQQMRNECLLSKMYLDIMDKISQQNDKSLRQFKCLCQLIAENRNNERTKTSTAIRNKPCCDETCPGDADQECKGCNCGVGNNNSNNGNNNGNYNGNNNGNYNGGRRRSSNNNYGGNGNGNGGSGYRRNINSNNQRGNNNSDTELYRKPAIVAKNQMPKEGSDTSFAERNSVDIKRYSVKSGPSVPDLTKRRSRNNISKKVSQQNDKSLRQFKCLCQLITENRNNEGNGKAKTSTVIRNKPCCNETCPCDADQEFKNCHCGVDNNNGNSNDYNNGYNNDNNNDNYNGNINGNNNGGRRRSSNNNYGGNGNGNGSSGSRRNSDSSNQRGSNNNNSDSELFQKQTIVTKNVQKQKVGSNTSLAEEIREIRRLSDDSGGRKSADIRRYSVKSGPSVPDLTPVRSRNNISKSN